MRSGILALSALGLLLAAPAAAGESRPVRRILCTTFPLHLLARNLLTGQEAIAVDLLLPPTLGCPHDYALTPQDLKKIAAADALITNGLGLETFLDRALEIKAGLRILDTSLGIEDLLPDADCPGHDAGHGEEPDQADEHHHKTGREGKPEPTDQTGIRPPPEDHRPLKPATRPRMNPHLFASPRLAAKIALNLAGEIGRLDPANAELLARNARDHAGRLERLATEFAEAGRAFANRRIAVQHNIFAYLARDLGLEIVAVLQTHPGEALSAADMRTLCRTLQREKAAAILVEPQYSPRLARTLGQDLGIPVAELDPGATGPQDAPLDHYERVMRANLTVLRTVLGAKPEPGRP